MSGNESKVTYFKVGKVFKELKTLERSRICLTEEYFKFMYMYRLFIEASILQNIVRKPQEIRDLISSIGNHQY